MTKEEKAWKADVDRLFEGDVLAQASTPKVVDGKIGERRVPTKKQSRLDLGADPSGHDAAIPRRSGESGRAAVMRIKKIIGTKISDHRSIAKLWNQARASVESRQKLTPENYKKLYDATRNAFWRLVQGDSVDAKAARAIFEDAGIGFGPKKGRAPSLQGTDPKLKKAETKVSLDHIKEKAISDNWRKALDADNLQFEFAMPNTHREIKKARHPSLRQE